MKKDSLTVRKIGRPRSTAAESHAAIMDAVSELLQKTSVRELTMEAIAKRANVSKATLYKWWPSKATLVFAMFHERLDNQSESRVAGTVEQTIRRKVNHIIGEFNGLFGKVMADLIAEGQSEPLVLSVLYREHIGPRRAAIKADIERGKAAGEFAADIDPLLMIDAIIGPIYFRMLLRYEPLTEEYGDELVSQVLRGTRP